MRHAAQNSVIARVFNPWHAALSERARIAPPRCPVHAAADCKSAPRHISDALERVLTGSGRDDFHIVRDQCPFGLFPDGRLNLELKTGTMKANVEFLKEVDLPQQERDGVAPGPGEDEAHGREAGDLNLRQQGARFLSGEVASQGDAGGLSLPYRAQMQTDAVGQNIDGRARIEQAVHLNVFSAGAAQSQREQGLKKCFTCARGDGQEGKTDEIAHAPEEFSRRYCVRVAAAPAASSGDQTGYPMPGWRPVPSSCASSLVRHWTTRNLSARESWWSMGMTSAICIVEEYAVSTEQSSSRGKRQPVGRGGTQPYHAMDNNKGSLTNGTIMQRMSSIQNPALGARLSPAAAATRTEHGWNGSEPQEALPRCGWGHPRPGVLRAARITLHFIAAVCLAVASAQGAALTLLAHYGFEGNVSDSTGQQSPFELLWNAGISNGVLCLGPAYQSDASTPRLSDFSYRSFTVAVDFNIREFVPYSGNILSGGPSYRWFTLEADDGYLAARFATKTGEAYFIDQNVRVTSNRWYQAVVSADLDSGLVQIYLDGNRVFSRNIGANQEFDVIGTSSEPWDKVFSFRNHGNASTLVGCADNLQVYNRAATPNEVAGFIAPRLRIATSGGVALVSTPSLLTGYRLESTDAVGAVPAWTAVTQAPLTIGDQFVWPFPPPPSGPAHRMFRLVRK